MMDFRTEYPRPQLVRKDWLCLNGIWDFLIDNEESGISKGYEKLDSFGQKINVPFCPESKLSGLGHTDFMNCVWYRRTFTIPREYEGKRIVLHFGAVDYEAVVFINGRKVGTHRGGYTPFSFDVTDELTEGENVVTLCAYDHGRSGLQPAGKQSRRYGSYGCYYTRTTGIWQTVWIEPVSDARVESYRVYPDVASCRATLEFRLHGAVSGMKIGAEASYEGRPVGYGETFVTGNVARIVLNLNEKHLWEAGCGRLYDISVTLSGKDGISDSFRGYFGLREVGLDEYGMTLNGKTFFGRWVLDQGFYPDGIYTAPSDEALKDDIIKSLQLGFNGARLHQKVFEPRFLYWADRLGYTVWGEHGNWGLDVSDSGAVTRFLPEWLEAVERDFSHPSLIGWCPFNETWDNTETGKRQCDDVLKTVYLATKSADPTRPVIDTSGNYHVVSDIFDVHDYEQDPAKFTENYAHIDEGIVNDQINRKTPKRQTYPGGPVFMSEYGGIKWDVSSGENGWGYGKAVCSEEEFIARYRALTDSLLDNPHIMGLCYTQLYDVEQERNGLMTYERDFKFDPEIFRAINARKAKIEEE